MNAGRRWGSLRKELEQRLSPATLDELIREFGGRVIRVPTPSFAERQHRRREVMRLLGAHCTYDEAAAAVSTSVSTVMRDAEVLRETRYKTAK